MNISLGSLVNLATVPFCGQAGEKGNDRQCVVREFRVELCPGIAGLSYVAAGLGCRIFK
jgi:hypothetical protein